MANEAKIAFSWADLPKELIDKIGKCLDTETDVLRFRAVCNSWRSSTAPFKNPLQTPIKLPFPFAPDDGGSGEYFALTERIVYRVQLPDCKQPNFWVAKVERSGDGKMQLLNPASNHRIKIQPETPIPKVLDTLNYRISEVCRAYTLNYVNPVKSKRKHDYKYDKKVSVSWGVDNSDCIVMAIFGEKELWYVKSGDEKWTQVYDKYGYYSSSFLDVVFFSGKFYAVDVNGSAWVFDSEFGQTRIMYNLFTDASKRRLVELYDRELYLVEGLTDKDKRVCRCREEYDDACICRFPNTPVLGTFVEILIYRMDKQRGNWVMDKTVDDRIIFAGDDCSFSLPAKEFEGCDGTRVFYTDQYFDYKTKEEKVVYAHECFDEWECSSDGISGSDCYDDEYFMCDCCDSDGDDYTKVDGFVPAPDVKVKFRELHGHNTGVCDFGSGFPSMLTYSGHRHLGSNRVLLLDVYKVVAFEWYQ
ncbi:hypothetical protein STAS_28284 [Striga asiatica]|uniref:KIB1-4 beta-propeller domain-containing protein n=1 Tax=Striga asiatica TaxID=4170 RepID=A0A5A7R3U8_STRAF|nr:hypothetical protein STAS_28284 [Striga asiatica]